MSIIRSMIIYFTEEFYSVTLIISFVGALLLFYVIATVTKKNREDQLVYLNN